jgi:CheY-like chemotaxis protein
MAALYLRSLGYVLVEAANGEDAVRRVAETPCALILMDLNLPGIDGPEATRRIRGLTGVGSGVPIVGMTAADHDVRRRSCLDAGMNDVVDKVTLLSALPDLLRRFIGRPPKMAALSSTPRQAGRPTIDAPTIDAPSINDHLGVAELEQRLGLLGRQELAHAFAQFADQGRQTLADLERAWRDGRGAEAAALAHRLGGGAATFQLIGLRSILLGLDAALRQPAVDQAAVEDLVGRLKQTWPQTLAAFERWLDSGP